MSYTTPEKKVQNAIIKWLEPLDHKHAGLLYWKRRDAIGANYEKGIPDLFVVIGPFHLEIECKAPGESLSSMQEKWKMIFCSMGTPYLVADSLEEFISFITPYLEANKKS